MNAVNDPYYSINIKLEKLSTSPELPQDEVLALVNKIVGEVSTLANAAKEHRDYKKEAELYNKLADVWRQVAQYLPTEWQDFSQSLVNYWETTAVEATERAVIENEYQTSSNMPPVASPKEHKTAFVPQNEFKQARSSSLQFRILAKKFKEEGLEEKHPDQITKGDTREFSLRNDLESDQKDPGEFRSDKTDKD